MNRKIRNNAVLVVMLSSSAWLLADCGSSTSSSQQNQQPDGGSSAVVVKLASLDGAQETPATGSQTVGAGILAVDTTTGRAAGFVVANGFSSATTAAHIHIAARGSAAPPAVPLAGLANAAAGTPTVWVVPDGTTLQPSQVADFMAGNFYFNVHTTDHSDGEIRGQIDKSGTLKFASLNGAQETPTNASTTVGGGVLAVDTTSGQVSGFAVANGFATGTTIAHVHGPAARGTPASPVVPLAGPTNAPAGTPTVWVVADNASLQASQIPDFTANNLYFNIHTADHTDGEIRGQIDKSGTVRFASLDGAQETPTNSSTTVGGGVLALDTTSGQVSGFAVANGFASVTTIAHVHGPAARGTPASPVIPLAGPAAGVTTLNVWVIADSAQATDQISNFTAGNLYYNIHTNDNPNGEIRGQIDRP